MGQSKGKIHDAFKNRIKELVQGASKQAQAGRGVGARPWQVPEEYEGTVLDVPELHEPAYNRDEINANYEEVVAAGGEESGTAGDVVSLKNQIAYVACEERAYRLRHASPVRCIIHGMASREGHGQTKGIFGGVQKMVEDAIRAGSA